MTTKKEEAEAGSQSTVGHKKELTNKQRDGSGGKTKGKDQK